MKKTKIMCLILALSFAFTSCYHARVTTGAEPGDKVVSKEWATSLIYGLVPPPVTEVAQQCPAGVAKVETKISFLNGLASSITFGIYTPMTITVTCAEMGSAQLLKQEDNTIRLAENMDKKEKNAAFNKASKQAIKTGEPVYISFN